MKTQQTSRNSLFVLLTGLFATTLTGLGIYFFHYFVVEVAEESWVRYYTRDLGVLLFTLGANIAVFLAWLIADKRGRTDNLGEYICDAFARARENHKQHYRKNKPAYVLTMIASVILLVFILPLFISLVFFNNSTPIMGIIVDIRYQLLIAFAFAAVIFILYKGICALGNVRFFVKISFYKKLIIAFMFLFAIQIVLVYSIRVAIGWDVGIVMHFAVTAIQESPVWSHYLSVFPNNLLIFFIQHHIIRLFHFMGFYGHWGGLALVNTVLINISLFTSIVIFKMIYPSGKKVILLFILLAFLIGLSPWLIVPYSDTFLMPIISLLILTGLLTIQAKTNAKRIIFASISGFLIALGWLIKPLVIVIPAAAIAVIVLYAFRGRMKIKIKNIVITLLAGGLAIFVTVAAFDLYTERQNIVIIDEAERTPASYTVAKGLSVVPSGFTRTRYGAWNLEVHNLNYGTTEEKNERFILFIQEQLSEFGVLGYLEFLFNKARWITSEGYFYWMGEGYLGAFEYADRNILTSFFYPTGQHYSYYLHVANGLWIVVFFGVLVGMFVPCITAFAKGEPGNNFDLFMRFAVFFSIFVILFTEGRSRYLISFLPIFCVVSAGGYSYFGKLIKNMQAESKFSLTANK